MVKLFYPLVTESSEFILQILCTYERSMGAKEVGNSSSKIFNILFNKVKDQDV